MTDHKKIVCLKINGIRKNLYIDGDSDHDSVGLNMNMNMDDNIRNCISNSNAKSNSNSNVSEKLRKANVNVSCQSKSTMMKNINPNTNHLSSINNHLSLNPSQTQSHSQMTTFKSPLKVQLMLQHQLDSLQTLFNNSNSNSGSGDYLAQIDKKRNNMYDDLFFCYLLHCFELKRSFSNTFGLFVTGQIVYVLYCIVLCCLTLCAYVHTTYE